MPTNEVTVGGLSLRSTYGAAMQSYPTFSKDLATETFQGRERSTLFLLKNLTNAMFMRVKVDFFGTNTQRNANQSSFEALFLTANAPVSINILDGFWYNAVLVGVAESYTDREMITTVEYQFQVTRHTATVTTLFNGSVSINCQSNVKKTDCIIRIPDLFYTGGETVTVTLNGLSWTYILPNEGDGHEIFVIDGIHKVFLFNDQNVTRDVVWTDFPYLVPGSNTISINDNGIIFDDVRSTIIYTPTFV